MGRRQQVSLVYVVGSFEDLYIGLRGTRGSREGQRVLVMCIERRLTASLCGVCREYYAGRNTVGSYLIARNVFSLVMLLGPLLTAIIIYWMTGDRQCTCVYIKKPSV
jgi:hypothetical protein